MSADAIFPYVPRSGASSHRYGCSTVRVLSRWFGSWNVQLHRRCHTVDELIPRYDARAESWDTTLNKFDMADAYRIVLSRALPDEWIFDPDAAPSVLDCGTGTGAFLSAFADAAGGTPKLHGIDISEVMLEQARSSFSARGDEAEFRQGEITQLPYPENAFDVVLAAHVIEHVPHPQLALAEIRRVLKPGGMIILCVTRDTIMGRAIQLIWRTHRVNEGQMKHWLFQSGFKAIRALRAMSVGRFDEMSIACVASKPDSNAHSEFHSSSKEVDHV